MLEERVAEAAEYVGDGENRGYGHGDGGERLGRVHAERYGKGGGDDRPGVRIDIARPAEGSDAKYSELHAAADEQSGDGVAHNETRNHADKNRLVGGLPPVLSTHDGECSQERQQQYLKCTDHDFPSLLDGCLLYITIY